MTPKEKAQNLISKFDELLPSEGTTTGQTPIECALIAVNEILEYQSVVLESFPSDGYQPKYWAEVKAELEKL